MAVAGPRRERATRDVAGALEFVCKKEKEKEGEQGASGKSAICPIEAPNFLLVNIN